MRSDKNKAGGAAPELAETLAGLAEDLVRLEVFVAAYGRSVHPERGEALRSQLPQLRERLSVLKTLRRGLGVPFESP